MIQPKTHRTNSNNNKGKEKNNKEEIKDKVQEEDIITE